LVVEAGEDAGQGLEFTEGGRLDGRARSRFTAEPPEPHKSADGRGAVPIGRTQIHDA
jgi:hypothetical protein